MEFEDREEEWYQFVAGHFYQSCTIFAETFEELVNPIWEEASDYRPYARFLLNELRDRVHGGYSDEQLWSFWRSDMTGVIPDNLRTWFTMLLKSYEAYLADHGIDLSKPDHPDGFDPACRQTG